MIPGQPVVAQNGLPWKLRLWKLSPCCRCGISDGSSRWGVSGTACFPRYRGGRGDTSAFCIWVALDDDVALCGHGAFPRPAFRTTSSAGPRPQPDLPMPDIPPEPDTRRRLLELYRRHVNQWVFLGRTGPGPCPCRPRSPSRARTPGPRRTETPEPASRASWRPLRRSTLLRPDPEMARRYLHAIFQILGEYS